MTGTLADRLRKAMSEANMNQKALANAVGVKPPSVNGWLSAKAKFLRGENLLKAAKALGVSDLWLAEGKGPMRLDVPQDTTSNVVPIRNELNFPAPDLQIARLENDIHALNLAIGSLVSVMVNHRPAEAGDVAGALRRQVPEKFRDQGLLSELLAVLDKAGAKR